MELRQLLQGVHRIGNKTDQTGDVSSVCYAADQCEQSSLFVAIPGLAHDGHNFIGQAVARGARFIVHSQDISVPEPVISIRVSDSRRALGLLAKNYYGDPSSSLVLVGITGTSGKTTVTYLLESILKAAGFNCGVLGTVNYRYSNKTFHAPNTTPESYELQKILRQMADEGVTHVLAEVSSHALDLKRVDDCDFDLGVFTNLSPEHLDYHKNMEAYFQAKRRLFTEVLPQSKKDYPRKMVINADDPWGRRILQEVNLPALTYGMETGSDVRVLEYALSLDGIEAEISVAGKKMTVHSRLIGKFNMSNILAAAAAASVLRVEPSAIEAGVKNLSCVPGRLERIDSGSGISVFVDYAHKPDALNQVLENLNMLKKGKIITVFGCGGNRDRGKRPLMGETATHYSDLTIVTSDNPRLEDPLAIIAEIEAGIDQNKIRKLSANALQAEREGHGYIVMPDRRTAIEAAIQAAGQMDIVLIAGKGHEDYQILGTQKITFDDRLVAAQSLRLRS